MATSNWQNISYNISIVRKINPRSILDVGVGFGRWAVLFREFLEIWDEENYSCKWNRIIDGVEIFPGYIKPYHSGFYNEIFIDDATSFIEKTNKTYDLVNCGDVIEHIEKNNALKFIDNCLNKSKYVLINIPVGKNWEQQEHQDNIYQKHLSVWFVSDFKKFRYRKIKIFRDLTFRKYAVVLLSNCKFDYKKEFKKRYGKYFYLKNFLKNVLHIPLYLKNR